MKKQPSSTAAPASYLAAKGWRRKQNGSPWCWYNPRWPVRTYHREKDAYDLQLSLEKAHLLHA